MNRREFLKLTGMGAMTVFLSGCGLSALTGQERMLQVWQRMRKVRFREGKHENRCNYEQSSST